MGRQQRYMVEDVHQTVGFVLAEATVPSLLKNRPHTQKMLTANRLKFNFTDITLNILIHDIEADQTAKLKSCCKPIISCCLTLK